MLLLNKTVKTVQYPTCISFIENKNISNKVEQKLLKDLKQYSLSLKYIAEENNISDNTVRNI